MAHESLRKVFGSKRVMEILALLGSDNSLHFSEIEARIETSSDVITRGLKILVKHELVDRTEKSPRSVEYAITDRGEEFLERADELENFLTKPE